MVMNEIEIIKPDDMHIHLRQGELLNNYVADATKYFRRVVVMPNTNPPIDSPESVKKYKAEIEKDTVAFEALMTFKVLPSISPDDVVELKKAGCIAAKLYPAGVTTNSQDGVSEIKEFFPLFDALQNSNMVLCIHAEEPGVFSLDRERAYLPKIKSILDNFPNLKVIVEHISDKASVNFVLNGPENLAASITVHHMALTLDNVIGDGLEPHHFCKPIPKTPEDRDAILAAALSGNPKFFLGTDSAPHLRQDKESSCGCAGVYTAPVALPILLEIFEQNNALPKLNNFTSKFGSQFYGLSQNKETLKFIKKTWKVPSEYHGVVPYRANQQLVWSIG